MLSRERIMQLAREHTVINGSHQDCNYVAFAAAIEREVLSAPAESAEATPHAIFPRQIGVGPLTRADEAWKAQADKVARLQQQLAQAQAEAGRLRDALRGMLLYFDKPRREEWCNEVEWKKAVIACDLARLALTGSPQESDHG